MRKHIIVAVSLLLLQQSPTQLFAAAVQFRTYLSVNGLDTNPCTVAAPCRLLPAALAATQNGGEIWILDSANYNTAAISIDQSVNILAVPGAVGSFVANGYDAIDIAGSSTISVSFHNLVFKEIDGGTNSMGIRLANPNASVIVDGSEFNHFNTGFYATYFGQTDITNSSFYNNVNGGVSVLGNTAAAASGVMSTLTIDHCNIRQNFHGISIANAAVTMSQNTISNNTVGLTYDSGSNVLLDNNLIAGNGSGVTVTPNDPSNIAYTMGNNSIGSNAVGVNGSLSKVSQQ